MQKAAMSRMTLVSVESLEKFCIAVLKRAGLSEQNAITLAESLSFADARGLAAHGVARLPEYLARVKAGVMNLEPTMDIEQDYPASALLNANNGPGQIAGVKAMEIAIRKARTNGVGLVGVKNSNHFGAAAFFAMRALKEDMIGLVLTNAAPSIAPYGAKVPLIGTNPITVAIPAATKLPIVLDMSTSLVARGKIWLASLAGRKIPPGWALDKDGKPTDDPDAALNGGSLEPIGGPKGSGLSLIIDLLCGVLTGTTLSGDVKLIMDLAGPMNTSHLLMAINIGSFVKVEQFKKNIDEVILRIKALPSIQGPPAYLPGEIEFNLAEKRRAEGIPFSADSLATLGELAERYGTPRLEIAPEA
jgi:LDH2 family malate/lactate/ureidoglycolate dehydrogenase